MSTEQGARPSIDEAYSIALGRSLHIGFIGLGQCGGNIAQAFAARDYPAIALNTSTTDLRSLRRLRDEQKVVLGSDGSGAGGSLSLGGEALRAGAERIEERALQLFDDIELVVAVAGLGGGTGGNLGELVNMLAAQDFPVVAMGVLPAAGEGHRAKTNALWALNELVDSDLESLILVDNEKLFSAHGHVGVASFLERCNDVLVAAVDELNRLSGNEALTSLRTFDPNDLRQVLRFGGVTVFGSRPIEGDVGRDSLLAAFIDLLNHNELLAGAFDSEDAVVVGSVITASDATLKATPASAFEDYFREVRMITGGGMHRTGIYGSHGQPTRLHVIAAGLPLPSRSRDLLGEATEEAKLFGDKKKTARGRLQKLDLGPLGVPADGAGDDAGGPAKPAAARSAQAEPAPAPTPDAGGTVDETDVRQDEPDGVQ